MLPAPVALLMVLPLHLPVGLVPVMGVGRGEGGVGEGEGDWGEMVSALYRGWGGGSCVVNID